MDQKLAMAARCDEHALHLDLLDGSTFSAPLAWYPTLLHASPEDRAALRLVGRGVSLYWEALDLDLSVDGVVAGRREQMPPARANSIA